MYGDFQSPANEGAYARYEERRFAAVDKDLVPYSHRELTSGHKFDGDIIVVNTCVKPNGEMLYPSSRDPEKIIPHKVAKQLPPTKPYGANYCEELLRSEWSCFFPKHK